MITVGDIIKVLEEFAPLNLQESYDNAGLVVGNKEAPATGVLLALDVTEAVIQEALELGYNTVVTHHPLIFNGLKKINGKSDLERCLILAVKNNLNLYASHTNMDSVRGGVNERMAEKLGLTETMFLNVTASGSSEAGLGMVGELPLPISEKTFLTLVKNTFRCERLRHSALKDRQIKRIALCGGSGASFLTTAIQKGADAFLTGEGKYNDFFSQTKEILFVDAGHYETEQFTKEIFFELISKNFPTFAVRISTAEANPVHYF
jgi:dinuclear metal center YbgI/SA1388 family protein